MGNEFDAPRARAKRPMPLWIDAFKRDTGTFEADEVGAYLSILMAMWSAPSLSLPNIPRRLARAAGVSLRTWNARIGPLIMPLLMTDENGELTQKRLRKEALYIERQVSQQSSRRKGLNSDNSLKNNEPTQSADDPEENRGQSGDDPTQQPNLFKKDSPTESPKKKAEPAQRGHYLPADWEPSAQGIEFAKSKGLNHDQIATAIEEFKNYWHAASGQNARKRDWDATFRNNVIRIAGRARPAPGGFGRTSTMLAGFARAGNDRGEG